MNLLVNGVNIIKYNKTHKFVTQPYLNPYFYLKRKGQNT